MYNCQKTKTPSRSVHVTTTMLSEPWIFDAAIFVTLRSISVVLLSLIPLRCQSCLAWQPSGARDKVRNLHFNICNNPEPLDFQLNKQVRTITQKYSMMASGSLEMLSLHVSTVQPAWCIAMVQWKCAGSESKRNFQVEIEVSSFFYLIT